MKKTSFKVKDVFGDVIIEDNFSQEQFTKFKTFLAEIMWISLFYKDKIVWKKIFFLKGKGYWLFSECSSSLRRKIFC